MNATENELMNVQTLQIEPLQIQALANEPESFNVDDRTATFLASDETPVDRYDWWTGQQYKLIFDHSKDAINLNRVTTGSCMFLQDHWDSQSSELGKVKTAEIKSKQLFLTVKFHPDDMGERYLQRVNNGTQSATSIGALPTELRVIDKAQYEIDPDTGRKKQIKPATLKATKWELMEYSAVSIPAIPNSGLVENQKEQKSQRLFTCSIFGDTGFELTNVTGGDTGLGMGNPPGNFSNPIQLKGTKKMSQFEQLSDQEKIEMLEAQTAEIEALKATAEKQQAVNDQNSEQITLLHSQFQTLQNDAIVSKREQQINQLRSQAESLFSDGKLTKLEYDKFFSDDAVSSYTATHGDIKLESVGEYLKAASDRQAMLVTGLKLDGRLNQFDEQPPEREEMKEARVSIENAWQQ